MGVAATTMEEDDGMFAVAILHCEQVLKAINDVCVKIYKTVARMTSLVNHLTHVAHEAVEKAVKERHICNHDKRYARLTERSVKDISNMFHNVPQLHSAANTVNVMWRQDLGF